MNNPQTNSNEPHLCLECGHPDWIHFRHLTLHNDIIEISSVYQCRLCGCTGHLLKLRPICMIKHPIDRGFIDSDIGSAIEVDEISDFRFELVKKEFDQIYPNYKMDGFKVSDDRCNENRMFLLYTPQSSHIKLFKCAYENCNTTGSHRCSMNGETFYLCDKHQLDYLNANK